MSMAVVNRTRCLAWQAAQPMILAKKVLPDARIANDAEVSAVLDEVEIQQAQNAVLQLEARLVMVELETVDGRLGVASGRA